MAQKLYYAVTDQHVIIPLVIVEVEDVLESKRVTTKIHGKVSEHAKVHHRVYFERMWLNKDGLFDRGNVFSSEQDAKVYAVTQLTIAIDQKQRELSSLKYKLEELS